ncbi:nucleoside permease [Bacillus toyonensis]|uniref:nucleoside permease n=1 Tax=Bacillus toyonensis TaxID=155322 RepID=UPI00115CB6F9|nr:nucleoside permease [Bacillus toyonensis]
MTLDRWLTNEERAIAKENGINYQTLYRRVYELGWDIDKAITALPGTVYHGYERKYEKWVKKAQKNGINSRTFYSRVTILGWECEEAATKPTKEMHPDKKYWVEIAKQNGINYQTFMSRVNVRGWELERAATTQSDKKHRKKSLSKG